MNDREAMRRETRNLRREVHESQQFADKLQKEKRDLSNEMDLLIRSRSEFNNNSNNQEFISKLFPHLDENPMRKFVEIFLKFYKRSYWRITIVFEMQMVD